jgi:hypothetical protein
MPCTSRPSLYQAIRGPILSNHGLYQLVPGFHTRAGARARMRAICRYSLVRGYSAAWYSLVRGGRTIGTVTDR